MERFRFFDIPNTLLSFVGTRCNLVISYNNFDFHSPKAFHESGPRGIFAFSLILDLEDGRTQTYVDEHEKLLQNIFQSRRRIGVPPTMYRKKLSHIRYLQIYSRTSCKSKDELVINLVPKYRSANVQEFMETSCAQRIPPLSRFLFKKRLLSIFGGLWATGKHRR